MQLDEAAFDGDEVLEEDLTELSRIAATYCAEGLGNVVRRWFQDNPKAAERLGWWQRARTRTLAHKM